MEKDGIKKGLTPEVSDPENQIEVNIAWEPKESSPKDPLALLDDMARQLNEMEVSSRIALERLSELRKLDEKQAEALHLIVSATQNMIDIIKEVA
jgi:hypothetical protein